MLTARMVSPRLCLVVLLLLGVTAGARGQATPKPTPPPHGRDNTVCTVLPDNPGNKLPDLPESFSMRVEANILQHNRTTTLHEYYDYDANIAAVRQIENGKEGYFFYLYNSNQFLQVRNDPDGGHFCFKDRLDQDQNRGIFGMATNKSSPNSDRVYSALGALHFANGVNEQYKGQEVVRGIPCNMWTSCQYMDVMDATATVTWYFSDETKWNSISGYTTPVRCHVKGTRWINQTYSYPFEHVYEFFDFESDLLATDSHFEVPPNTYCNGETNTKPIPQMPPAYSFDAEILDLITNQIQFTREQYDNSTMLVKYDFRTPPKVNSGFGVRYVSRVDDFKTGVSYKIDVLRANCTTTLIDPNSFDDVDVDPYHVRLSNPNEFVGLNYKYTYQGVRVVRGVQCDTWVTERYDYPDRQAGIAVNPVTVWTWYFATEDWMKSMGFRDNLVLPIMLEIFSDDTKHPIHRQLSIYEYDAEQPDLSHFDISSCYGPSSSRNYAFLVPGRFRDVVGSQVKQFKFYVTLSLEAALSVSSLRIAHLDVQEAGENVLVTFDLLDKAPLSGDVTNPVQETSLEDAYNVLTDTVNSGSLKILVSSGGIANLNKLTVKPAGPEYQIQAPSRGRRSAGNINVKSSSGYSGGAMGGMAVGMLLLGALVGFAVMFVIYRVKGGIFGTGISMQRFSNEGGVSNPNSQE